MDIKMKKTDKRTLAVRIVAIILAVIMGLGVFAVLFNSFAVNDIAAIATGSQDTPKWPILAAVGALIVIIICVVVPKLKKGD